MPALWLLPQADSVAVSICHPGNQQASAHIGDWFLGLGASSNELLQSRLDVFNTPIHDGPGLPATMAIWIQTQLLVNTAEANVVGSINS